MEEGVELLSDDAPFQLCVGIPITHIEYHEKLNVIFVGNQDRELLVVDPTLGDILYYTKLEGDSSHHEDGTLKDWDFSVGLDKMVLVDKEKVGIRSEYNGIILAGSMLQTPISNTNPAENVQIELTKVEAEGLCQAFTSIDKSQESEPGEIDMVEKQLRSLIIKGGDPETTHLSVKKDKWATVKLDLPHSTLKSTFQTMVQELWKNSSFIPQLSIASSILERLNMLLLPGKSDTDIPLDKNLMFSEYARLATFASWPHMDYKWALPEKMAQAGFFHNPSTNGDDRALCFTCSVCLVSWEPTDEPWSEHERHSPFCPFVRGEHTHNVPLYLSYATAPAFTVKNAPHNLEKTHLGSSSFSSGVAVGYSSGLVVVWDIAKQVKEVIQFKVAVRDFETLEPLSPSGYCDLELKPKEAWVMDISDSAKSIMDPEILVNVAAEQKITLTAVSLVGPPLKTVDENRVSCPPSVIVGGTIQKKPGLSDEHAVTQVPVILVFGLSASTFLRNEEPSKIVGEIFKATGNTGTKQETQTFEEDIYGSFMSESDLMSDSISIFSDLNMSDSSGTFVLDPPTISSGVTSAVTLKKKGTLPIKKSETGSKIKLSTKSTPIVSIKQKLDLPADIQHCSTVRSLVPTPEGTHLIVKVECTQSEEQNLSVCGAILVYQIECEASIVLLNNLPIVIHQFESRNEFPVCMSLIVNDHVISSLACVLYGGDVQVFSLPELLILNHIRSPRNDKIRVATYCSSLERLCCGTNSGRIEFYAIGSQTDSDFSDERTDPMNGCEEVETDPWESPSLMDWSNQSETIKFTASDMKQLIDLTVFQNIIPCFTANVPSCWVKIIQAQKERKHPQHLQHHESELDSTTLSWRLQRNKNSRKEHLFEITLPKSAYVGHLDVKFLLQMGCVSLPAIEVTLYRVTKKKSKGGGSDVDKGIDFGIQLKTKTSSSEFLKSINAKVVCGPLDLGTHVDLSSQGGNLVMTSPSLVLMKGRNFYLHIRAKSIAKTTDNSLSAGTSTTVKLPKTKDTPSKAKSSSINAALPKLPKILKDAKDDIQFYDNNPYSPFYLSQQHKSLHDSFQNEVDKKKDYNGCDWLHEISISIRQTKPTSIPNELSLRKTMLTSSVFLLKLLETAVFEGEERTHAAQNSALDLLVWIAAVNLCGPQAGKFGHQLTFLKTIQSKLVSLILHCVLLADRATAHKCSRLFVLCIDSVEAYHSKMDCESFLFAMLSSLLTLLPYTVTCTSAGSLQWFFLLLNRVRNHDLSLTSESLLNLLNEVSKELSKRTDPIHAVLRARFGLYGTPFEPELFELELPPVTKSYSHTLTYAGMCGIENSHQTGGSGLFHLWGLKDVDFRDLLIGNPLSLRWGKVGLLAPKQQIQGLLEVEPLHFILNAASDGTRIEKIDLGVSPITSSAVPLPQPWEPFTNMPTGEGSKKSEPDKMEQIMMLQKAFKLDQGEAYFDVLNDLKFMESNVNMVELPYHNVSHEATLAHHLSQMPMETWKNVGVLKLVLPPSQNPMQSDPSKLFYGNFTQPALASTSYNFNPMEISPGISASAHSHHPILKPTSMSSVAGKSRTGPQPMTSGKTENDGLRLLLSPWQQMMYVPPQQVLVIDRMHSGARRFVVLDFGSPVVLTDMVVPSCSDLVSLSIDIWLQREEVDGQRLVVASDIGIRSLVICDLQPPPVCRYLKITTIGRYGMGTTKCRIPLGMFYGHTAILPNDIRGSATNFPCDVPVLTPANIQAHLSVLSYLVEDIGCRYQLSCAKLKRLMGPLMKPEISSLDHTSYYLPKGKERNKLGLNSYSDQTILSSYHECITLQQQLNVAKNVVRRLQNSLTSQPDTNLTRNPLEHLPEMCTDKVHVISEFLIESLLGISFLASNQSVPLPIPYSLYTNMNQSMCENFFRNICVLENGQCQLSTCTLLLRVCGFQPWWGKFLTSALKNLFKCSSGLVFPQDRVFILLVYLGQKSLLNGQNSAVLESAMELLQELLSPATTDKSGFLRSNVDMTLLGWVVMYLCLCLDGVNCTLGSGTSIENEVSNSKKSSKSKEVKDTKCLSSRWDFIQGESALYRKVLPTKAGSSGGFKRRIQKKIMATKQKLEELDTVAAGLGYPHQIQQATGLGTQLTALGNKIEAIKQKQASLGKSIKIQSSKVNSIQQFKDLLQMKRTEMLYKRGLLGANRARDEALLPTSDVEINLSLNSSLCLSVAKGLASLLLRMDSTCHSDMYLMTCKALARIATSCRPAINLGSIFDTEQCIRMILTAVGSDYVRQRNWSTSWISHAIMCLIEDILEGEKLFPFKAEKSRTTAMTENIMSVGDESTGNIDSNLEDMPADEIDAVNDVLERIDASTPMESNMSLSTDESDFEDVRDEFMSHMENHETSSSKKYAIVKRLTPCVTSISTALDARLEIGVESTTELRLRMMSVVDSELLTQSFKATIDVPPEILKNTLSSNKATNIPSNTDLNVVTENSLHILASSFDQIFLMMASENCSISIEKVLQLWISINHDMSRTDDTSCIVPSVPLARESIRALMSALTKNTGIGVQEWGLGFQCLSLAANQKLVNNTTGCWLDVLTNQYFPQMLLRFISGSGMNLQKSNLVSAGPTVCQHFYNLLLRLRQLSCDSPWTPCLKEILLRVLGIFLAGPFLNADFPLDAFNKFLDRVLCPDLSYENAATVVNIVEQFAQVLHLFVFFPNKIIVRSNAELKGAPTTSAAASIADIRVGKSQTLEHIMFRLVSLMSSIVSLSYKSESSLDGRVKSTLTQMGLYSNLDNYDHTLSACVSKCGGNPKTIGDLVLQMEPTMMRILSVLANPNGINVLVSGDLLSAFNIMEPTHPTNVVDSVIQLFSKLCGNASQPQWTIQPLFKFLSKSMYDDFCCPLIVSETFVLMILQVIHNDENLKQFTDLKCVESVCEKLVSSTRKFFTSCPTFVSILTQYIGRTESNAIFGHKKLGTETMDAQEGVINVAPLGTITSNNFSAHPSDVLLQAMAPHRRARTPVWSYHFFPEESFLELIITLPCAILLKEVQIVPHVTSLSTSCPAALMVEVSRDRSNLTVPMGPPIQCSGMSTINIQLTQPEVAHTVLLRLFKPKDSSNLGLSQIRLLGCTTFSEAALQGLSQNETAHNLESSAHWMYILDRAISAKNNNVQLKQKIIETALNTPDILEASYSMLMAPASSGKVQDIYLPHVASVLFHFGSLRKDVSDQLMSALLGPVQTGFSHGMVANSNVQSTACLSQLNTVVELIYKLCCDVPIWGYENLVTLFTWLEQCADEAVLGTINTNAILPEYVQAVAASLWTVASIGTKDLSEMATAALLKKLLIWARKLDAKCELKAAVDQMICSLCFCTPWLFIYLMFNMGFLKLPSSIDSKTPLQDLMKTWYDLGIVWDRVDLINLPELKNRISSGLLMTLARAAQSPSATNMLRDSKFLDNLNTIIMDFWSYCTSLWASGVVDVKDQFPSVISTPSIIGILEFFGELCRVNQFKNWLGQQSIFWRPILNLLSTLPGNLKASFYGVHIYDLESVVINFLTKCCWSHLENQKIVASCLCEIILKQKTTPHKAVFLHSMSSFCRRLLIQLLLENEKLVVHIKSSSKLPLKCPQGSLTLKDKHPSMGVSGGDRIFFLSFHSQVLDLMKSIEPFGTSNEKSSIPTADSNRFLIQLRKEQGIIEAGLEMIDNMQSALNEISPNDQTPVESKRPIKTASKKLKCDGAVDTKSLIQEAEAARTPVMVLECEDFAGIRVPPTVLLSAVLAAVQQQRPNAFLDTLVFLVRIEVQTKESLGAVKPASASIIPDDDTMQAESTGSGSQNQQMHSVPEIFEIPPLPSTVEVFSRLGGLGLLAKHLPVVYPETLRQIAVGSKFTGGYGVVMNFEKESPLAASDDWVKVENADDFYDEMIDSMMTSATPLPKRNVGIRHLSSTSGIPPHSMAAFGLFLSLPRFPEVLLGERVGAQCMLRLVMGVADDADGNDIFASPVAKTLPVLPFQVLKCLLDVLPVFSDEGRNLRNAMVDIKAIHFILACVAVFTHQTCDPSLVPGLQHEVWLAATKAQGGYSEKTGKSDDKSHVYWAKGTGFGTGSTAQSWDIELAMQKKKAEEENVTCLLLVLSSFINPKISHPPDGVNVQIDGAAEYALPNEMFDLLKNSSLFPAIAGYLRNDSVLDMARHVPLYKSVLQFLRSLVSSSQLLNLLAPWENSETPGKKNDDQTISFLLSKMKDVVDSYAKRLMSNSKKSNKGKSNGKTLEELEDEGLALLIPDIQTTAIAVEIAVREMMNKRGPIDMEIGEEVGLDIPPVRKTLQERYLDEMRKHQFAFHEMIVEEEDAGGIRFTVSHHYEGNVRANWSRSFPARLKRLAQENVTLSTSLPIAYGSTIFVRCDTDRLDVMKVLITGPEATPYANGCFEFDVYFPNDYPNAPMMINLETNGRQRVRFNPNLYTDGKVCLSILNTWHGRPEEKWNPQTSSLLPVLVAIQSLILNAEPYFNEPGYEKSRGTDAGERNSREYNAGIEIATVEWAMLDQIRHPSGCFKDIIHRHFWMKRVEIILQCEQWLEDLVATCRNDKRAGKNVTGNLDPVTVLKNNVTLLKKELANMKPPEGLEDLDDSFTAGVESQLNMIPSSPSPQDESQKSNQSITVKNSEEINDKN